ncbi:MULTISPECIES: DUF4383 domain-containing protein [Saccharopolyspora]|uniref:DUF4383 domain-containing protein n=1 Tax=Saccharopolyspora cebuensis TaxID=418759 RepID=A0ABV4CJM2_9PSEU
MTTRRSLPPEHPLSRIYRIVAALLGAALVVYGALVLGGRPPLLGAEGAQVYFWLSGNGMLGYLSVAFGAVLVLAAAWGGKVASTTSTVAGVLFFLAGLAHLVLFATTWNPLGFNAANVVFSLAAGALLVFLGVSGRVGGPLPPDDPRHRAADRFPEQRTGERPPAGSAQQRLADLQPLSRDEAAVAAGTSTPQQQRRVRAEAWRHQQEERRRAYEHYAEQHRTEADEISAQNPWQDEYPEPRSAPPTRDLRFPQRGDT